MRVWESDVSLFVVSGTDHLDHTVLSGRSGQADFSLWMTEFAWPSVAIQILDRCSPKAVAVM